MRLDPTKLSGQTDLLQVQPPTPPDGFDDFWRKRYSRALQVQPKIQFRSTGRSIEGFEQFDLRFFSSGGVRIGGWMTVPTDHAVRRAFIVGHGYGGCPEPTNRVPIKDAAYFWPCLRGLGRSFMEGVPQDPYYHVLYDIDKPEKYIIGGCVDDVWVCVSAIQKIFPAVKNRIGLMGISFSGGVGTLAAAWDERISQAHFQVPTFGHHPIRLKIPSHGSAKAVQDFHKKDPKVLDRLAYFDAASAARFIEYPVHVAAALYDPYVAAAGQFAIYNALRCERSLYVLEQGHSDYPNQQKQQDELLTELTNFFAAL